MEHENSSHNNQRLAMEGKDISLEGAAMKGLKRDSCELLVRQRIHGNGRTWSIVRWPGMEFTALYILC